MTYKQIFIYYNVAGAIIREIEHEILTQGTIEYQTLLYKQQVTENLMRRLQVQKGGVSKQLIRDIEQQTESYRVAMRQRINKNFGSVFRTQNNPTTFGFAVGKLFKVIFQFILNEVNSELIKYFKIHSPERYVDLYTSRIENFLQLPADYRFIPPRKSMPHGKLLNLNLNLYQQKSVTILSQ